jgi:hypothetical protein
MVVQMPMQAILTVIYTDGQTRTARRSYASELDMIADVKREYHTLPFDGVTVISATVVTTTNPIISYGYRER